MKKSKRINFWLNDKDYAIIEQRAKAEGLSQSEYIRKLIGQAQVIPPPDIDFSRYEDEFRIFGYQLNDIVKGVLFFRLSEQTGCR